MQKKLSIKDLSYISLFAALVSVSGYIIIPLPFSAAPVTAQTLAVMLTGSLLPVGKSVLSLLIFILMGAAGLPVFSGGTAGLGVIMGKTGGYLIGFIAGAALISLLKGKNAGFARLAAVNTLGGIVVVYTFGVFWLNYVTGIGISQAFIFGALTFIPGDILKVIIASVLSLKLSKHMK
ncbi:MAG: biotin transporter BioY [Gracilibacteraceae bacterium]|nr:biotin transporter BioY [Gracilibacteraceae bacterium]